jgi:hypothetical protein
MSDNDFNIAKRRRTPRPLALANAGNLVGLISIRRRRVAAALP